MLQFAELDSNGNDLYRLNTNFPFRVVGDNGKEIETDIFASAKHQANIWINGKVVYVVNDKVIYEGVKKRKSYPIGS